jgi:hypothetical protein
MNKEQTIIFTDILNREEAENLINGLAEVAGITVDMW